MKPLTLIIAALAASLSINVQAITVDEVLNQIKSNNLQLKAASAQAAAETGMIKSSNNLDNPEVDGSYLFGKGPLADKWEVGISQQVEWPGVYKARADVNKSLCQAVAHGYSQQQLAVINEAYSLCLDIIGLNRQTDFCKSVQNNLNQLFDTYNKALQHGEVSIIDVNKLKIERVLVQQKIDEAVSLRSVAVKQLEGLNAGLSISGIEELNSYPAQPLLSLQTYIDVARNADPSLAEKNALLTANAKELNVAKAQSLPSFSLGYRHVNEMGDHFNGITMGVSLPVFANRGKKSAAKAQAFATEMAISEVDNALSSDIEANYRRANSLKAQIDVYESALNSVDNITVLDKALAGGQMSLLTYLQELRYFVEARGVLLDLERDFNKTLAELNKYSRMN
ncbi:MAG: TolC family protein [Muribaculaceae bacterium]